MNMADNKSRELSIKVNVDISEALTGLKALQREAKKATQALRELEGVATLHAGEVVLPREQAEKLANYKSDTLAVDGEHLEEFVRMISEALAVKADE
ncbi:hypothetical protein HYI36_20070 [Bacillus sp. Gen3]|nr:hypothetical protein [Bacillus sp. Gen3]